MKTDKLSLKNKSDLFQKAHPMHDCSFTISFKDNTLVLIFDNLDQYCDFPPYIDDGYKKATVKYYGVKDLILRLKFGRKEKIYFDTLSPLEGKELTMFKYSVDSFDAINLNFYVSTKKKLWDGTIEISPSEIEYIWE